MQYLGTVEFETPRLLCRRFAPGDERDMFKNWAADPEIQREYGEPTYGSIAQVRELLAEYIRGYQKPGFYWWAIVEKAGKENIGQIAFCRVYPDIRTAEIEYCIGRRFWGKGYAGEALAGVVDFTFRNTEIQKLEAYHRGENVRSGKVLARSAMHVTETVERFRREGVLPKGEVCYCLEREEYLREK